MGKYPPVAVVVSRQLEYSVFPITSVPRILRKTSVNSKFAFYYQKCQEGAQRSVRLNLLFVKNKASWHEGPQ